mmetsp:Transcript_39523/g.91773  ORF Transcript_39523/g.91773 Transcript_39523/m.91773 type:complete len:546 (-) Transcript_39523:86-1723(-)|eukprot:CAMPEP_0171060814 /NCGR_PEP_ID=MMETSP0766_2-20121228/4049_1 /TAXON_ID=439317 /ORGANISM="Gambierdiscus australes, Strain CAWD 149" /LENGTH=545 /DNA_ID=CAMNT_0011516423 /DNA_START=18 /DNA_END=1655 /DNA_ORIENTATION=+
MLEMLRGSPDVAELKEALAERDQQIKDLEEHLRALQEADQRDFLNDNSDQLASIITTKNQVIQDLQAQLQQQGHDGLAQALESARTSAAEVQRLWGLVQELQSQLGEEAQLKEAVASQDQSQVQHLQAALAERESRLQAQDQQLQIYRAENDRQAAQLATSAASNAMEVSRLQASLKTAVERAAQLEGHVHVLEAELTTVSTSQQGLSEVVKRCQVLEEELRASKSSSSQQAEQRSRLEAWEQALCTREEALAHREQHHAACLAELETHSAAQHQALQAREANAVTMAEHADREGELSQQVAQKEQELEQRAKAHAAAEAEVAGLSRQLADSAELVEALKAECLRVSQALEAERRRAEQRNVEELALQGSPAVSPSKQAAENANAEVARLKAELLVRTKEVKAARTESLEAKRTGQDLACKAQRLEAQLARARQDEQEVEQRVAKVAAAKGVCAPLGFLGNNSGGVAGAITAVLQDVEVGQREGVTLHDLGLADFSALPAVDHFLQILSALMAVRADARLAVFGLWILCHCIYVVYLIYEHFVKK